MPFMKRELAIKAFLLIFLNINLLGGLYRTSTSIQNVRSMNLIIIHTHIYGDVCLATDELISHIW